MNTWGSSSLPLFVWALRFDADLAFRWRELCLRRRPERRDCLSLAANV
jgi:hypothetical protein